MGYPLHFPGEAKRLFTSELWLRRVAATAHWSPGARLLELIGSTAGLYLAKEMLSPLTVVDSDPAGLKATEERARAAGLSDRLTTKQVTFPSLPFAAGSFDGVLCLGRVPMSLEAAAQSLRGLLAPRGRLVVTTVVQVGRQPSAPALEAWKGRLGHALLNPRESLMTVERQGYEPETIETLSGTELDDYYKDLEQHVGKVPGEAGTWLKDELALFKALGHRTGVSYAVVVARRKEPGEKPPAARDGG
ncbi:MAG: class I SAM-dependent methyltransferase [Myxococcaceae bacterium]|nr:class I SAM-dependent methyltransferase [Myxococcaceae bacterium]